MDAMKDPATGSMTKSLLVLAGLIVVGAGLAVGLRESPIRNAQSGDVKAV